jgi:hypothetical protein
MYKLALSKFHRRIRLIYEFRNMPDKEYNSKLYVPSTNYIIRDRHNAIESIIENTPVPTFRYKKPKDNLSTRSRYYIKFLNEYNIFKVTATDKNMGPAITTKVQYTQDVLDTLKDTNTYSELSTNTPTDIKDTITKKIIRWTNKCKSACSRTKQFELLRTLKYVTHELHDRKLSYFYLLYKVHKVKLSTRPIVSSAGSIYQGISTWLDQQLRPYLNEVTSFVRDSSDFVDKISTISLQPHDKMFSLDVVSMYTNIHWEHAKPIMLHYCKDHPLCNEIIAGLELIMTNNYFTYDQQLFLQTCGTAMGNPVAPTYAILYLAYTEQKMIAIHNTKLICYLRYIDDIFLIWRSMSTHDYKIPQAYLRRSKLDFTATAPDDAVVFLDMTVYKEGNKLHVREYQKPGNPHLYVPAHSAHPPGLLKAIIYGNVKRLYKINSKKADLNTSLKRFTYQLSLRGYSMSNIRKHLYTAITMHVPHEVEPILPVTSSVVSTTATEITTAIQKIPFVIQYDPGGPCRKLLMQQLQLRTLTDTLTTLVTPITNITYEPVVAYTTGNSLRSTLRINKA